MIRTIAIAVFGLALASAAQAMPLTLPHQPDAMITQARMGCGAGMVMVNGTAWLGVPFAKPDAARDGTEVFALSGNSLFAGEM